MKWRECSALNSSSQVLTALSVEETEKRLEDVSAQLDALHNLPRSLRPSVQHIKEELQQLVEQLLEQVRPMWPRPAPPAP